MTLCLVITAGFSDTNQIGIAVVAVMLVTTYLMTLMVWPQASDGGHRVSGGVWIS
jgi:hypothetical protein